MNTEAKISHMSSQCASLFLLKLIHSPNAAPQFGQYSYLISYVLGLLNNTVKKYAEGVQNQSNPPSCQSAKLSKLDIDNT